MNRSADWFGNTPATPCTWCTVPVAVCSSVHCTPSERRAASMTAVSSDASRSTIATAPCDNAASSRMRLEMDFDPGRRTTPSTRRTGARSRNSVCVCCVMLLPLDLNTGPGLLRPVRAARLMRACRCVDSALFGAVFIARRLRRFDRRDPLVARTLRVGVDAFQRRTVAGGQMSAQRGQLCQIRIELGQQRRLVGQADVAPHFRRRTGDAREVPKAAGRELEQQVGVRLVGHVVDQRIGQQMRQMADGGENLVMLLRRQTVYDGAAGLPRRRDTLDIVRRIFRQRRQHELLADIQIVDGRFRPVGFAAGDGMPGTNCATLSPRARRAAATTSDLVLPASVTTVPACRCGANADSIASACATGAASNTRSAPLIASAISSPMMSMMPSSRARASDAAERSMPTTVRTAPAFFSARANEPPIKPTPKMTILFNTIRTRPYSASALVSAAIRIAFSCGRPMEMRSHSGRP